MKIIKGYTNFGMRGFQYKFVIVNNILIFRGFSNKEVTHISFHFWDFIKEYKIKYFTNRITKTYNKVNDSFNDSKKTTRQSIKDELFSKKFNADFENKIS